MPRGTKTRIVGGRRVVRREDEEVIARTGEWLLVRIDGWCKDGWSSLKLLRNRKGPKNVWMLGAKGGRLARNKDAGLLSEHHPKMVAWVLEQIGEVA